MIKIIYIFISILFVDPGHLFAQDQTSKSLVTFNEVIEVAGVTKDTIQNRTQRFFSQKNQIDHIEIVNRSDTLVTLFIPNQFKAYSQEIIKNLDGEIGYDLKMEIKDDKYRYTFTNFVYRKYVRNRYSRMVLERGKGTPIEAAYFKGRDKTWKRTQKQTEQHVERLMASLKQNILSLPQNTEGIEQTANW